MFLEDQNCGCFYEHDILKPLVCIAYDVLKSLVFMASPTLHNEGR